jgi:hypothetical protein
VAVDVVLEAVLDKLSLEKVVSAHRSCQFGLQRIEGRLTKQVARHSLE